MLVSLMLDALRPLVHFATRPHSRLLE
jgi:hypothetical protein